MITWLSEHHTAATTVPPQRESRVYRSLALNTLCRQFRPERRYKILDLGAAFGANVDFFSQFSCEIYIEDLYQTLTSFDFFPPDDELGYADVFEYLLPYRLETRFDVILAWDLFNYLEQEEYLHLTRRLSEFSRPGSRLFALISTRKHIPDKPINYKIVDRESVLYEGTSTVLRPCPRYEQSEIQRLMPSFRVTNSFLLRNGVKEYIFTRD
jgi:hypothetical protein